MTGSLTRDQNGDPLWEMNPTKRFSNRAVDYAKYRPTYPAKAIEAILRGMGDPARLVATDIGAGTGISARLLADRGVRVIAIEPNVEMQQSASAHPRVEWRAGEAEATGLLPQSMDLVQCAQAFHWFQLAAQQGQPAASIKLGYMLAEGRGTRKDVEAGYQWVLAGTLAGDHRGKELLDSLARQLTQEQREHATKRAHEMREGPEERLSATLQP